MAKIVRRWDPDADAVVFCGDNRELMSTMPSGCVDLVVTSPPYNVGKEYETRLSMDAYLDWQAAVIGDCVRLLAPTGSICWQVGNHVDSGAIVPLDVVLYPLFKAHGLLLRNRIVWHFGHGLHSRRRFSGRYETVLWFTRDTDDYCFNLDAVRIPQKYPGKKHYKGQRVGQYSGHPSGKNPSDYWEAESETDVWDIPNVKANHVEKTTHPCQFPVALITRLVRALTPAQGRVFDPYMGVGTSLCAALLEQRRAAGAEIDATYYSLAYDRIDSATRNELRYRPVDKPVYVPVPGSTLTIRDDAPAAEPPE